MGFRFYFFSFSERMKGGTENDITHIINSSRINLRYSYTGDRWWNTIDVGRLNSCGGHSLVLNKVIFKGEALTASSFLFLTT